MSEDVQQVIKTLIIGLGSTGTAIADGVADRVAWELQSARKAPWVRYLCIETNENEKSKLRHLDSDDFRTLSISGADYTHILETPQVYDEKIRLSTWMDEETLRKLPGKQVAEGAGNIRMVGRLAFLFQENYHAIKQAVQSRLDDLRTLSESEAKERRGKLQDGRDPAIEFAAGGHIRVIITGTLCGGTCSGLAPDFGYFLERMCEQEERRISIFTLPHPSLTSSIQPKANRFKKNAYHSLIELNHYHLTGREHEARIRFPDGLEPDVSKFPYDITFLVMPRSVGTSGEEELNQAVSDRIFLNVFVPQTDPFAKSVDASVFGQGDDQGEKVITDRDHRAHVFSTFGLSTVEFPAQQVTEACSKRLLAYALRNWQSRDIASETIEQRLSDMGLTGDALIDTVFASAGDGNLKPAIDQRADDISRLFKSNLAAAEKGLKELRDAFLANASSSQVAALAPGSIPTALTNARRATVENTLAKIRAQIRQQLLDYYDGPSPLRQVLQQAQIRLDNLRKEPPMSYTSAQQKVDGLIRQVRAYHQSPLLNVMGLKRPALERLIPALRKALKDEVKDRCYAAAYRVLHDTPTQGQPEPGVLEQLSRQLKPYRQRVDGLMTRTSTLLNQLTARADKLARNQPELNGVSIFEPESAVSGTVKQEYEACIVNFKNDATIDFARAREGLAADIISKWPNLVEAVALSPTNTADDWLRQDFSPNRDSQPIPDQAFNDLLKVALEPFGRLSQVDIVRRWKESSRSPADAGLKAKEAAGKAKPFLEINRARAEQGGRSPINTNKFRIMPASSYTAYEEEFTASVKSVMGETYAGESPDTYRIVLLEEWYRFPLTGASAILGSSGIHDADCRDFPTFHTRKDVFWTGMSDAEITNVREAEELVVTGVLLNILKPKGGALELEWQGGIGDTGVRRLPLSVQGAARYLARQSPDLNGQPLRGATKVLRDHVEHARKCTPGETPRERDKAFIGRMATELKNHRGRHIDDWDERQAGELLERHIARDTSGLYEAYQELYPPNPARVANLRFRAGETGPRGIRIPADGLYCSECGGLIGETEQEAAQNGWRCYVNPSHHFGL
jgi:hypothetical protein